MNMHTLAMILSHTPVWVWGLLAALLLLGLSQTRDRWVSPARLRRMPWVFVAFSVWSTINAFGWQLSAVAGFLVGARFTLHVLQGHEVRPAPAIPMPLGVDKGSVFVPGSWMPLAVMMLIFVIKYISGVTLAMVPGLATQGSAVLSVSLLNGALAVILLARSQRLLKAGVLTA